MSTQLYHSSNPATTTLVERTTQTIINESKEKAKCSKHSDSINFKRKKFADMRENGVIRIIHFIVGWSVCLFFNAFAIIQMAIIWWKNKNAFAKPKILPKPDALENWIHGKAKLSVRCCAFCFYRKKRFCL